MGDPVRAPRLRVRRVIGEQIGAGWDGHPDLGQGRRHPVQGFLDQGTGDRVDGDVPVLVGLGIFAELPAAFDHVAERDVDHAIVQVDVADLESTQFPSAGAGPCCRPARRAGSRGCRTQCWYRYSR